MSYNIPLFDLNYGPEEEEAIVETIRSKWISAGPKCAELEELFANMLNVKYACAVTNCTVALHMACIVLGIGKNDEVICPSLTFAATVNAIKYVGASPVFCDIKSNSDLTLDCENIKQLITPKTRAIIVMHYGGHPCKMDEIMEIAKEHNLYIIEDACNGPLSEYNGKKLGTIGTIGCFSFFSNKNISTGEGGMVVTNDEKIYKELKNIRSHGMTTMSYERASGHATEYDITRLGYNYRYDDLRASLAIVQIKKLRDDLEKRQKLREWYLNELKQIEEIVVPFEQNTFFSSNYIFATVLLDSNSHKRNYVRNYLHKKGIQTSVHYPAVHKFAIYEDLKVSLPKTEYVSDNEITLPMYAKLNQDEIIFICRTYREALDSYDA